MSSKQWRHNNNICTYSSTSKEFNVDSLFNNEGILTCADDYVLIWLDASINKDEQDDQYSLSQLGRVIKSISIFINEQKCLEFINEFRLKNKLFLIVSGSLGENFVPKIYDLFQINFIYIFCGQKKKHEIWTKKYEKIKGVFDNITELCAQLKRDKDKLEQIEWCRKLIDSLPKKLLSSHKLDEFINFTNPKYDDRHQPKDDIQIIVTSADIPFGKEETCSPIQDVDIINNIHSSETVAPYMEYKQQMEFSDTGVWPCVSVIDSTRNEIFNHVHSVIETVEYFNSSENCLQHVDNHPIDPHLIVISNPTNVEHLSTLIRPRVQRVYIYCSNNRLQEYDRWSEKYPNIVSVLQYVHTLIRLILWDLSACIMNIGNFYYNRNEKSLAQARYRYVYRLHVIIQGDLNNRMEMIESNQSIKFNN